MAKKKSVFNKVIGYKGIVAELKQLVDQIKNDEKYKAVGARIPHNLLITGDPGLGKTLLATCVIEECEIPAFTVRKDAKDMCEKIEEAFARAAECEKAIVFLDDMDKYSNQDRRSRRVNTDEYVCIQSMIDEYRESDVFVIATVNEPERLPDSLVRAQRFDIRIECTIPDNETRVKIVESFLKQKNCSKNVDARRVAHILGEHSVAALESVINRAALQAAYAGKDEIDSDDIITAALKVWHRVSNDEKIESTEANLRGAAHQAAHLVVSEILSPGSCTLISLSSINRNVAFEISKEDDYWDDIEYQKNRVTMLLAGKAGVEIVHGVPAVNVCSDIDRAFNISSRFIQTYCSRGFETFATRMGNSNYKVNLVEKKTAEVVEECYNKAKKILIENRDFLDAAIKRLLKDNVLTSFEIEDIKRQVMAARKQKVS